MVRFKLVWFRYQQLPRESSICTEVKALSVQSLSHVWKSLHRGGGVCLQHCLFVVSSFLPCQGESKVDLAFQPVLQHPCCGKLLRKMAMDKAWLPHKGVEGMTGGSPCARGRGDSWRKEEKRGWCGTRDFEQGNCLTSTVLGRKKLIY